MRIVTLPVDAVSIVADVATGGDGSKRSRVQNAGIGDIETIRDQFAESVQQIDQ